MGVISKSKFLNGLQCPLLLWVASNSKSELPPTDAATQAVFDQGHTVGSWAKRLYPSGVEVPYEAGFAATLSLTQEYVKERRAIFEASLSASGLYARADVLSPAADGSWDITEVKSTTSVKQEHLSDLAFQKHCFTAAGLAVSKCFLMRLNPEYVRQGPIDPAQLFVHEEVSEDVAALLSSLPAQISSLQAMLAGPRPKVPIGPQCSSPHDCPLMDACWAYLPEHNVTELYYVKKLGFQLLADGVLAIAQIPASYALGEKQLIQKEAIVTGKMQVNPSGVAAFLGKLAYPLSYLDFETFAEAIPRYDGLKPYQAVPFQYSLHIDIGSGMQHKEYLSSGGDPRQEFLESLLTDLPSSGSVVTYNASFEMSRLRELKQGYPAYAEQIDAVLARVVDLLEVFRSFAVYHPSQHGSCSIKKVLPALCGSGYEGLEIGEGETASNEYVRVTYGEHIQDQDRQQVRNHLLAYCKQDTQAMADLMGKLKGLMIPEQ